MNELLFLAPAHEWQLPRLQELPAAETPLGRDAKRSSTLKRLPMRATQIVLAASVLLTVFTLTPTSAEASLLNGAKIEDLNDGPSNTNNNNKRNRKEDDRTPEEKQKSKLKKEVEGRGRNHRQIHQSEQRVVPPDGKVCGQALTIGYNPETSEEREFPTTCLDKGFIPRTSRR